MNFFYKDFINYSNFGDSNINLFVDITTICNLHCSYCFARKEKEWNRSMPTENIDKIITYIKLSPYQFNIILFGGEALLHKDIEYIVNVCNNSDKVDNTIILSNGLLGSEQYKYDALYGLTPHIISEEDEDIFINNCLIVGEGLKINIPLNIFNTNIERLYNKLKKNVLLEYVKFSVIYDDDTKNITPIDTLVDRFPYIDFTKDAGYILNGKEYDYIEYLKLHLEMNPKEQVDVCYMNELNIDISGVISNDCLDLSVNIFNSPLFFKNYRLGINCSLEFCKDCTGTITCSKTLKDN